MAKWKKYALPVAAVVAAGGVYYVFMKTRSASGGNADSATYYGSPETVLSNYSVGQSSGGEVAVEQTSSRSSIADIIAAMFSDPVVSGESAQVATVAPETTAETPVESVQDTTSAVYDSYQNAMDYLAELSAPTPEVAPLVVEAQPDIVSPQVAVAEPQVAAAEPQAVATPQYAEVHLPFTGSSVTIQLDQTTQAPPNQAPAQYTAMHSGLGGIGATPTPTPTPTQETPAQATPTQAQMADANIPAWARNAISSYQQRH
jgi:hypothetical protein